MAGEYIVDLSRAHREWEAVQPVRASLGDAHVLPPGMIGFLEGGAASMEKARAALELAERQIGEGEQEEMLRQGILVPMEKARLQAPVPRPGKPIAAWVNYGEHGDEAAVNAPKAPLFFSKYTTAVIGPGDAIVLPRVSEKVDYEAELAVVIGKRGKHIPEEKAYDHVAGYTILNDVSARDFSLRVLLGVPGPSDLQKSFDTFAPMGPWMVTRDEIAEPHALGIRLSIGDEVLQEATTAGMIHRIPAMISYLSDIATLEPGDVLSTGTPAGVGFTRVPPRWLRAGETVRIEIEGIGVLENPVVSEAEG